MTSRMVGVKLSSMATTVQKMVAMVTFETGNGYLKLEFQCPRPGVSIADTAQELARCFARAYGDALGLADQSTKIAELEASLLALKVEAETKAEIQTAPLDPPLRKRRDE